MATMGQCCPDCPYANRQEGGCSANCSCRVNAGSAPSRGLDWLNFFIAAIGTGFGAFVPAYLAAQSWTQAEVGAVLSVDTLASMFSQVPAGALVDAMPRRRTLLAV